MVGPAGLGVSTSQLRKTSVNGARIGSWPTDFHPWDTGGWIPNAPYVYNNDPNNHGGYVPAGGMTIDGFHVPAGVWVAQFDDFDNSIIVTGDSEGSTPAFPGVVFRGCRWRGSFGSINVYRGSNTRVWFLHNDAGGLGAADAQYNEAPYGPGGLIENVVYRNYFSYTTTGIGAHTNPQIIENYIEKLTLYYGANGPPGESGQKHLNGITMNGGDDNALVLRNKILLQTPDEAGHTIDQTDAISFFQDFGDYTGTGKNLDGTIGYQVRDNYVGGGGYSIYAGMNAGKPAASVQRMVITGNQITTRWWPNGGYYGPFAAEPVWGSYGNVKANNTWAESGQPIP